MDMKNLLADVFPDLKIQSLSRMGSGKAGEIFLVNDEIVFKVALESDESHSELRVEYDVLCALHEKVRIGHRGHVSEATRSLEAESSFPTHKKTSRRVSLADSYYFRSEGKMDVAVPRPLYFGTLPDGRKVLGMSFVPGVQFTQEIYEEFSASEKDALFAQLGGILSQLHSTKIPQIENISMYDSRENLTDFHKYYTDAVKNALSLEEQRQIQKIADDFEAAVKANPVPLVLCHGDLHFGNLNYDPATKKICGLLDFGIVCFNDGLNDMRYFWSDTVIKMLRSYSGEIGEGAAERHLFYNICNLIEEAHGELASGEAGYYVDALKKAMFQEPLADL
ncbi:MAG: aminoglycoside phosphotransferase family protein [Defluviitaleaceae bacterium]|nr:aminoglycoside phosphotransferase family protein [Defluviitaleaceae bacterium]